MNFVNVSDYLVRRRNHPYTHLNLIMITNAGKVHERGDSIYSREAVKGGNGGKVITQKLA